MITIKKWTKIALVVIEILVMVLLITFAAISTKRGRTIKAKDIRIEQLMKQREELMENIKQLGAESCVTINCSVNIKAPNVFGQQNLHADAIAKTMATITRQELLDYKDSIDRINNTYNSDTLDTGKDVYTVRTRKQK